MFRKAIIITLCLVCGFASLAFSADLRIIDCKKGDSDGVRFGNRCEGLGDVNGDGYGDFVVAEYVGNPIYGSGKLHLYLGGPHPLDSAPSYTWNDHFAYPNQRNCPMIVNVGDIDCDGVNDLASVFGFEERVALVRKLNMPIPESVTLRTLDTTQDWFGHYAAGGGDNNNDGRPELWVFDDDFYNDTIWGYSGCDLFDTIPDLRIIRSRMPDNNYRNLGLGICSTCDINGDGIPDIVYGQYNGSTQEPPGRVCVVWGGSSLSQYPDLVFYAPYPHDGNPQFGQSIACLEDISGDGIDDIWVSQGGRNYIYHGGRPFDTIPDWAMDYSFMYPDVENVGDINHDGWNDVAVFMPSFLFSRVSFVYCYPGMDTLVDVAFSDGGYYSAIQQGPVSSPGLSHARVGDVNGDGRDDLLLGAMYYSNSDIDPGWAILQSGWDDPDAASDEEAITPDEFQVRQNYPNPFNSGTTIEFTLPRAGYTELKIYNLLGELVATPLERQLSAGEHRIVWDGNDISGHPTATGIYFYRLKSGNSVSVRKMIMLR